MRLLGIDVGSAAVKAAILHDGRLRGGIARSAFPTRFEGLRVEVDAVQVEKALASVLRQLGRAPRNIDAIAIANMAPSWVAMDRSGKAITPVVTHQDRRSVEIARELEKSMGAGRILRLSGNRPFPGGISSTTFAWFLRHQRPLMKKADLAGHLSTYLHRQLTGARVTDPSNASFMGLYSTLKLSDWNDELIGAIGASRHLLPDIQESDRIAGRVTASAATRFGLIEGTPVLAGCMDGSAAMLLAGASVGQMMDVSGSTDVLALCTDRPHPHRRLLTRALGIGRRWLMVSTIAAAGSALSWMKQQFFQDLSDAQFWRLASTLAARPDPSTVQFEPYLAGDRMSIAQRMAAFSGLTLATTREQMLSAVIESLARASAERIPLLRRSGARMRRRVMASGGVRGPLEKVLHRDWPGKWTFFHEEEATLRGLGRISPRD